MRWMSACTGALLFGVAAVSGCTTSNLKAPIGEFSKATDSAKDFLQGRQDALDKAVLAKSTELATTPGSPPVYWDGNECTLGAPSCRLFVNHADFPWPINNGALNHNVLTLMLGLSTYGKNLANIANAETATQVDTALAATKASGTAWPRSIRD